jgi:hypothetical protein
MKSLLKTFRYLKIKVVTKILTMGGKNHLRHNYSYTLYSVIWITHTELKHVNFRQCAVIYCQADSYCTESLMMDKRPKHVTVIKNYVYLIQLHINSCAEEIYRAH